jgi:hypothetical protein
MELFIARAYVYSGDWVADCPRGCGGTEQLFDRVKKNGPRIKRKESFFCSYCKLITELIEWPADEMMAEIQTVLNLRPIPHNRNWYPKDHGVAIRFGIPHGQSVQELREENLAHGVPAHT